MTTNQDSCSDDEHGTFVDVGELVKGPLNKRFFIALIQLENQIKSKIFFSMQQVLDLVQMYGLCVEYFDLKHDPAKWYFMEKISNTLSESKTSLYCKSLVELILQKEKEQEQIKQEKLKTKPIILQSNVKEDPLQRQKQQKPMQHHKRVSSNSQNNSSKKTFEEDILQLNHQQDSDIDYEGIKKIVSGDLADRKILMNNFRETRQKKLTIIEQIQKGKSELNQSDIVSQWDEDTLQKDNIIKASLEDQQQSIQSRLLRRKETKKGMQSNSSYASQSFNQFETL